MLATIPPWVLEISTSTNYNSSKSNTAGITIDFGQGGETPLPSPIESYAYNFKGLPSGTYVVRQAGGPDRTVKIENGGGIDGTIIVKEKPNTSDRK